MLLPTVATLIHIPPQQHARFHFPPLGSLVRCENVTQTVCTQAIESVVHIKFYQVAVNKVKEKGKK